MRPEMERRRDATQKTVDRFRSRPFEWGKNDCARMAAFHLRAMNRPIKTARAGSYKSAISARAALRRMGAESLAEIFDRHFARIAPAAATLGDLVHGASDDTFGAVGIVVGNGRILGFHEDAPGAEILQPTELIAAWRVI